MKTPNNTSDARVLVVKMSSLGDLFHALPAVHSLKTGLNASIDWVVNRQYASTVACFGDVDRTIAFPRDNLLASHADFIGELRKTEYDLVCDMQGLLKSAYIALRTRAKRKIGPSFCREGAHLLYRERAGARDKNRHAVEECLDVVGYLGLKVDRSQPPLSFPEYPLDAAPPLVAFAPVSRWETKNWPPEHFVEVGRRLLGECGASICIVGGPSDRDVCARIADGIGAGAANLAGKTSIPQLGGVLGRADLLIAVDSGPVHIAAALGTPVLGLYGITNPLRTGPYGEIHRVIRSTITPRRHGDFRKPKAVNLAVMASIDPQQVAAAAHEMLAPALR